MRRITGMSDLYIQEAAKFFKVPEDKVTPKQRQYMKDLLFPLQYTSISPLRGRPSRKSIYDKVDFAKLERQVLTLWGDKKDPKKGK